jgi:small neutral amino acid transporter SnatA (MarC family)
MSALIAFLVAVNPPVIAAALPRAVAMRTIAIAALLSTGLLVLAAVLSEPVLDLLDVSAPTFRVAAGAVLAVAGIRWAIVGARPMDDKEPRAVTLLPRFFTPQLLAIAITVGVDDGAITTTLAGAAALLAAVVAAVWRGRGLAWWSWSARLVGLGGVAVGLALVVDGVKTV